MKTHDSLSHYRLKLSTDSPLDLSLSGCSADALHTMDEARGLHVASALGPQDLLRLRAHARYRSRPGAGVMQQLERGYLLERQLQQAALPAADQYAAFLSDFRTRLIFLGTDRVPENWLLLGWIEDDPGHPLALSRDSGHVILLSGTQGSGKTLLSTIIAEGCLFAGEPLAAPSLLPTSYTFFHIEEQDRLPQLLDALKPNPVAADLELLAARLGVGPRPFVRLRLVLPPWLRTQELLGRLRPYRDLGLEILELKVHLAELGQPGLEALLGAEEGARYVQRMLQNAQDQGGRLRISEMRTFIDEAGDLNSIQKLSAHLRLDQFRQIEAKEDAPGIWALFGPGVATVVYLGGPHMGHARIAPLLVGLMHGLMMPSALHGPFQRVITVDEVNLLAEDKLAWRAFIRTGRMVRHRGSTLILLGQDLLCVPDELFGLAGLVGVMPQRSPRLFEHVRERVGGLRGWRWEHIDRLRPGSMLLAVTTTTDPRWQQEGRIVRVRPPLCLHGGMTRAMV